MPKPYSIDLRERVVSYVEAGHSRRAAAAHFSVAPSYVINLMRAFGERGGVAPKALGGWRHSKLDPHRVFILRRVAEKDDITMPELAAELLAASGVKADPASLSHWLIRNGLSFKKKAFRPANAIGPTCARRARRGRLNGSPGCEPSRTGWFSSTRREPKRREPVRAGAARKADAFAPKLPLAIGRPRLSSPDCAAAP